MSKARELYQSGQLGEALSELTSEVKANPTDASRRAFLFELLCFAGEWDRAEKQLGVISQMSAGAEMGATVYLNNIKGERARQRLLTEGLAPHFLSEPPPYVDLHLEAVNRLREGNVAEARATLDRAEEDRPAFAGELDCAPFEDFRDYDDLFAPVLELIVMDKYTWLPFEQVRRVEIAPPTQLRDLVWAVANVETTERELKAFVPARYAGSEKSENDLVRLGRMTDWRDLGESLYAGAGLRILIADGEEKSLFSFKTVSFGETKELPVN
jgi:type VI secretion system protein ImpE